MLAGGLVAVSTAATLTRMADAPPLAIAAYRMLFAACIVMPLAAGHMRRDLAALSGREKVLVLTSGGCLAVHFALWIASLGRTSVASSVALVTTSPLWVAVAAPIVLHQPFSRRLVGGIVIAFAGAILVGGGDLSIGGGQVLVGDLMALGGALAAAGYFLIGGRIRPRLRLSSYVALVYGLAAAALLVWCLIARVPMTGFSRQTWIVLLLLGAVPQVLGHSSFNWALSRLSTTFVTGTVLGEAVGSTVLAWIVLGEEPPALAALGGALVLTGLFRSAAAETARGEMTSEAHQPSPRA